jgi:hypothetical protein
MLLAFLASQGCTRLERELGFQVTGLGPPARADRVLLQFNHRWPSQSRGRVARVAEARRDSGEHRVVAFLDLDGNGRPSPFVEPVTECSTHELTCAFQPATVYVQKRRLVSIPDNASREEVSVDLAAFTAAGVPDETARLCFDERPDNCVHAVRDRGVTAAMSCGGTLRPPLRARLIASGGPGEELTLSVPDSLTFDSVRAWRSPSGGAKLVGEAPRVLRRLGYMRPVT